MRWGPPRRHSPPAAILAGILAPLMLEAVWAHEEAPLVRHLGCFRDADMGGGERVVRSIEHQTEHVQGMYKSRPAAVEACAVWIARACPGSAQSGSNERQHRLMTPFTLQEAAYKLGFPGFAIQDGGSCHSDATIFQRYDMWGSVPADYLLHQRC